MNDAWAHADLPDVRAPASAALIAVSVPLVLAGLTAPSWASHLERATKTWPYQYWLYWKLGPLWKDLATAFPDIAAPTPPGLMHIERRLYRRVIEIHDGLLHLQGGYEHATDPHHDTDTEGAHAATLAARRRNAPTLSRATIATTATTADLHEAARSLAQGVTLLRRRHLNSARPPPTGSPDRPARKRTSSSQSEAQA